MSNARVVKILNVGSLVFALVGVFGSAALFFAY